MHVTLKACEVRSWRASDLESLVTYANNRNIWVNLRDRFPHPYTTRDGSAFLKHTREQRPETAFAIAVNGEAVGGIGFQLGSDVERVSAEIGYWLGEPFWGRGIAIEGAKAAVGAAFEHLRPARLISLIDPDNQRSVAVAKRLGMRDLGSVEHGERDLLLCLYALQNPVTH